MATRTRNFKIERDESNGGGDCDLKLEWQKTSDWINIEYTDPYGNIQKFAVPCDEFMMIAHYADKIKLV